MSVSQLISPPIGLEISHPISQASQYRFSYGRTNELTNKERSCSYLTLKSSTKPTRTNETRLFAADVTTAAPTAQAHTRITP